jgi:hypothetical protein
MPSDKTHCADQLRSFFLFMVSVSEAPLLRAIQTLPRLTHFLWYGGSPPITPRIVDALATHAPALRGIRIPA